MLSWANTRRIVSSCSGRSQSTSNQKPGKIKRRFLRFPLAWSVTSEGDNSKSDPIDSIRRKEGSFLIPGHGMRKLHFSCRAETLLGLTEDDVSLQSTRMCPLTTQKELQYSQRKEGGWRGSGENPNNFSILNEVWPSRLFLPLRLSLSLYANVERHTARVTHSVSVCMFLFHFYPHFCIKWKAKWSLCFPVVCVYVCFFLAAWAVSVLLAEPFQGLGN